MLFFLVTVTKGKITIKESYLQCFIISISRGSIDVNLLTHDMYSGYIGENISKLEQNVEI